MDPFLVTDDGEFENQNSDMMMCDDDVLSNQVSNSKFCGWDIEFERHATECSKY